MLFIMYESDKNSPFFLLPFCDDIEKCVGLLENYTKDRGIPLCFLAEQSQRLSDFEAIFSDRYNISPAREDFEYIYLADSLKTLSGKTFHSKRNHISAFSKKHSWAYEPLSAHNLAEVFEMADLWAQTRADHEKDSLLSENSAMKKLLPFMEDLEISGGVLRVEEKVVAFCFGCPINERVFDVQVEKALPEYREAYTVINQEFALHLPDNFIYINREDDMGIEGLRKAKLSYKPKILLPKYFITPKEK